MKRNINPQTDNSTVAKAAIKRKFRRGAFATLFTVICIAIVIALNVLGSVLSANVKTYVDTTANNDYTLSDSNKKYLKKVPHEVTITLCATESDYTDGVYSQTLSNSGYNLSNDSYLKQTVYMLKQYARYDSIKLEFADTLSTSFSKYTSKYSNETITMGDIIVASTFTVKDEKGQTQKIEKHKILKIDDIYELSDYSSYAQYYGYYYSIDGSNLENAVTSAIYSVTSEKSYKVAVVTSNNGQYVDALDKYMTANNYTFYEVGDLMGEKPIEDDTDVVIIARPTIDYTESQLAVIENYLADNDKEDKTVFYIASSEQGDLVNLNDFLSEWGFVVHTGNIAVETDNQNYYINDETCIAFTEATDPSSNTGEESTFIDYLEPMKTVVDYRYVATYNVPITIKETMLTGNRSAQSIIETADTAVAKPLNASESWRAKNAKVKGPFIGLGGSVDWAKENEDRTRRQRVFVLSSMDFITTNFNDYSGCGNLAAIMASIDFAVERDTSDIYLDTRTINTTTFEAPSTAAATVVLIVFAIILPLSILIALTVVGLRRRHL